MKIVITGGAGFIAHHLIKSLIKDNEILCIDNFELGTRENIVEFIDNPNFKLLEIDCADKNAILNGLKDEKIDMIYHLAANSDIKKGGSDPSIDFHNTFLTTYAILEVMKELSIKNLFFASTSAVYGEITDRKIKENQCELKPISYYGSSKASSEAYINAFSYMNDLNVIIFRFANVIGPNLTHGVIYDFSKKLKENNNELTILGDGNQSKPYIYVTDLVNAILKMTQSMNPGVKTYNVGVLDTTSVTDIANIICEELEYKNVEYKYTGGNVGWKGDVPRFEYDLSKIYAEGWTPQYSSNEAVRETVKKLKKQK